MRFGGGTIVSTSTWESVGGLEEELEEISSRFRLRFGSRSEILEGGGGVTGGMKT